MNLFNQNYHIKIHMRKLQLEKNKKQKNKIKRWGARRILWKVSDIYKF